MAETKPLSERWARHPVRHLREVRDALASETVTPPSRRGDRSRISECGIVGRARQRVDETRVRG